MWLGSGVIGGIGLGLGYISPVSTLIKWFPDRRGMATGMAIMGFGGGAMIGSPLATKLMAYFATPDQCGRLANLCAFGANLYGIYVVRCIWLSCAASWLEARQLDTASDRKKHHDCYAACAFKKRP